MVRDVMQAMQSACDAHPNLGFVCVLAPVGAGPSRPALVSNAPTARDEFVLLLPATLEAARRAGGEDIAARLLEAATAE
jgi:hypothetical protein